MHHDHAGVATHHERSANRIAEQVPSETTARVSLVDSQLPNKDCRHVPGQSLSQFGRREFFPFDRRVGQAVVTYNGSTFTHHERLGRSGFLSPKCPPLQPQIDILIPTREQAEVMLACQSNRR